ncbi:MAG: hypothetical protein J1E60_07650 [Christensenellaceae bacterium]|nr:hypothetical protein [Christensenellaceae bacterium]
MKYRLLREPKRIHKAFTDKFVQSYSEFVDSHSEWISSLKMEFNEEYYSKMYMWERIIDDAHVISFVDALELLKGKSGEVLFLTEPPNELIGDFSKLNNKNVYAAASTAQELAECIVHEWFTKYELFEQGCYLVDPILPDEVYVFDESLS